jgi:serine/threonine protein kinase
MSSSSPATPHPADQDALPPGTRFGELEIRRVLGIGGFGIVYLAVDHALEREVALKEYMPSSLASRGQGSQITVRSGSFAETYAVGLRSFVNEARLLAKFDHPSMVKVYRFWEENGTAYMVMPYLQGRTLREARRAMAQPPDEAWIRSVLDPVLAAVELLHREGVYHRDIAPDNILLPPDAAPILLDFGAARRVISDRTQSLTAILKPSYAPIEQYAEMASLRQGPWTDIYAIGAVMHFLLFGVPPPPATARAVQDDLQGLAARRVPGASPRLMATLAWTLAVRPADRPQNIDALRAALDGRITPPASAASTPAPTGASAPPTASSGYEPTQRAEGSYARPTQVQDRHASEETIVQPLRPRSPPPVPPAPAAAAPSRGGMIAASIGVVAMLVGGAGWWLFGGSRPAPASAAAAPATVVGAPAPVVATPALPTVVAPAPDAAAVKPAVDLAATRAAEPAVPAATKPTEPAVPSAARPAVAPANEVAARSPATALATPPRQRDLAAGGALPPRPAPTRAAEPAVESPRPAATETMQTAALPAPVVAAPTQAPPAAQPLATGPATAREACGSRMLIALALCMERECKKPQYRANPECVKLAEERRQRQMQ